MRIKLLKSAGYDLAILGAMLSKGRVRFETFEEELSMDLKDRAIRLAPQLAGADGGHNKYLEQIQYWAVIDAPLYFWKQFDTYRVGVSKSSESTMFRMWKGGLTKFDFENPDEVVPGTIKVLNHMIDVYNSNPTEKLFRAIITNLPDGYLQTRLVNINAKSLRNIYAQRKAHKLTEWRTLCKWIEDLPQGYLITKGLKKEPLKDLNQGLERS